MALNSKKADFLPANTELLVSINPDNGIAPELRQYLESNIRVINSHRACFVRIRLLENLKIKFKLHPSGNISRELEPCNCEIPALPAETIRSLNQAYQKISAAYEPYRTSVGGRVYENVFYCDHDEVWKPLEELREIVYKPFQLAFEKQSQDINENRVRQQGVRLPDGNCILVRKDSNISITYFPQQMGSILGMDIPFDDDGKLMSFGPFDNEFQWECIRRLENEGLVYGRDFVHFHNPLPNWCRLLALPV